ncbi:MAG TPA: adenine phosphoribosyltransferase [Longimicrobiaceae bacterium]|nr:adenine phosphoribosyltransferase [Longimicrobiaceae bacterium]
MHDGLKAFIRDVPDFPTQGILFRDITPLLRDAAALRQTVDALAAPFRGHGVDVVAGVESRGFLFGAPLALALGVGFIPIRKRGKLPSATIRRSYALEYGANELEIHSDAVHRGERVLLVDDVLATGGTAAASAELVEELGGHVVGLAFVLELAELAGRARLPGREVVTLLTY